MSLKSHQLWTLRRCGFCPVCLLSPMVSARLVPRSQPGAGGWVCPPTAGGLEELGTRAWPWGPGRGLEWGEGLLVGVVLLDSQGLWVHGLHMS